MEQGSVRHMAGSIAAFLEAFGLILAVAAAVFIALVILIVIIVVIRKKKKAPAGNDYAGLDQQLRNQRLYNGGMPQGYPQVQVSVPPQAHPPVQASVPPQNAPAPSPVQVVVSVPESRPAQEPVPLAVPRNGHAPMRQTAQPAGIMSGSANPAFEREKTHLLFNAQGVASEHKVTLTSMADPGRIYACRITDKIVIGRNPACCDIAIPTDNAVSERHCEISFTDNRFYICDIGSSNGTSLNGCIVGSVTQIRSGDIVKMGRIEYRVTLE